MPHHNNEIITSKKMRFTKLSMMFLVHLRCTQYNKYGIAILFQFGPLVSHMCIFHRQFMKLKMGLHPVEDIFGWFKQAYPYKLVFIIQVIANITEVYIGHPQAVCIGNAVYNFFHGK